TCLKFDFISSDGVYSGGAISPGLQMRYEALHSFTDQLPLLAPAEETPLIGNSTAQSIHSGIVNGMIAEIEGITASYQNQFANVRLILTGGDSRYFLNHLKKSIFADPELTLKGLQFILLHNCTQ
ncbi:MAG: type III pantothenate kinase, partial [Bacteroidota bacterium]